MSGRARREGAVTVGNLREEQRRERSKRILDAAARLFNAQGYEKTAVETIAAEAGVSPATIYNYFESKPNIVMALARRHHADALPERLALIKAPPRDPRNGVRRFQNLLIDQSLRLLSREAWRVILQALYLEPGGIAQATAEAINSSIMENYRELLARYRAAGSLERDIDVEALAQLLFAVNATNWRRFIGDESLSLEALKAAVDTQVDLVLRGLTPARRPTPKASNDSEKRPSGGMPK